MLRIIDQYGQPTGTAAPELKPADLRALFRYMLTARLVDEKAFKLQRQGRMGTFAPSLGHEACQVGSAFALHKGDWFFPYFRDLGGYLALGFPLENYFLYWMGDERGMAVPEDLRIFPIAVPVGSQIPHAVGAGMAARILKDKTAVLCTLGDGATSEGDFHEAFNFAGVFKAPVVFICFNNQYAISLPRARQTASKTLAEKAEAYGFEGVLVDGNDVLAVYAATNRAVEKARGGDGPTFIEAFTYRMSNHTTSDDASKYRGEEETAEWAARDPILRFRVYLEKTGLWNETWEAELTREAVTAIDSAIKAAEATPLPSPDDIFRFTYEHMTPQLIEQLRALKADLGEADR